MQDMYPVELKMSRALAMHLSDCSIFEVHDVGGMRYHDENKAKTLPTNPAKSQLVVMCSSTMRRGGMLGREERFGRPGRDVRRDVRVVCMESLCVGGGCSRGCSGTLFASWYGATRVCILEGFNSVRALEVCSYVGWRQRDEGCGFSVLIPMRFDTAVCIHSANSTGGKETHVVHGMAIGWWWRWIYSSYKREPI